MPNVNVKEMKRFYYRLDRLFGYSIVSFMCLEVVESLRLHDFMYLRTSVIVDLCILIPIVLSTPQRPTRLDKDDRNDEV